MVSSLALLVLYTFMETTMAHNNHSPVYTKFEKIQCYDESYGSYDSLAEAKLACSSDSRCTGVYDQGCDSESGDIFLCPMQPPFFNSSTKSCMYVKSKQGRHNISMNKSCFHSSCYIISVTSILNVFMSANMF